LATSSFYALSGLCYNNKVNADMLIKTTNVAQLSISTAKEFKDDNQLIETVCSLFSNLTFKNEPNKIVNKPR
jgi:hypothetical protein